MAREIKAAAAANTQSLVKKLHTTHDHCTVLQWYFLKALNLTVTCYTVTA